MATIRTIRDGIEQANIMNRCRFFSLVFFPWITPASSLDLPTHCHFLFLYTIVEEEAMVSLLRYIK